jgi:polysaccharide export outer membrane protein
MPFDAVVSDPRQNIILQKGDVVSVSHQTKSFTVLGATAKNDEINFETSGISLMQALARAGGLNDNRADARGVFIFRYESIGVLTPAPGVEFRKFVTLIGQGAFIINTVDNLTN